MIADSLLFGFLGAVLLSGCQYVAPSERPNGVGIEKTSVGTFSIVVLSCPKTRPVALRIASSSGEVFWLARRQGTAQGDFDRILIGEPTPGWIIETDRFAALDPAVKYYVETVEPPHPSFGINFVMNNLKSGLVRAESDMSMDDFKKQNLSCSA